MRGNGISYDTGYRNEFGVSTHEPWDPEVVARDLRVIRDDLHCTAVRVTGGDPDKLETAARLAADLGLEVWFSPFTGELTTADLLVLLADCAERAERLRLAGADVVLVTGAELSLFTVGFLPGSNGHERTEALLKTPREQLGPLLAQVPAKINDFLADAVRLGHLPGRRGAGRAQRVDRPVRERPPGPAGRRVRAGRAGAGRLPARVVGNLRNRGCGHGVRLHVRQLPPAR
ncbi:hypothetical protein ACQPZF_15210 [Actinosynnema sp. CS-041913]|uniref:hypothetical protein n=1 Tax=Actinosynnema sp. CS-041913 TaxID=3239917 RepID=UPI003D918E12